MQILNDKIELEDFYRRLAASEKRLLMLDYDGTLAPFTVERDKALPYPEVATALAKLLESNRTRVVIISGRTVDDLKKLLNSNSRPELWGCHGLERHTSDGTYSIAELSDEMRQKLSELYDWTAQNSLVNFFEFKPSGGAFHWRGLPAEEAAQISDLVIGRWQSVADTTNLELFGFDGGVEIRVSGTNKGIPVANLLSDAEPDTVAAYLGDDLTDEDAFKAIEGRGLSVLVRESIRSSAADIWIEPPDELRAFLERWL
jgi:trehalose 6-phosphate phosphatase